MSVSSTVFCQYHEVIHFVSNYLILCNYLVAVCPLTAQAAAIQHIWTLKHACLAACYWMQPSTAKVRASEGVSDKKETVEKLSGVMDKSAACMHEHMGMESNSVVEILPKRKGRWREIFLIWDVQHISLALCFGIFLNRYPSVTLTYLGCTGIAKSSHVKMS